MYSLLIDFVLDRYDGPDDGEQEWGAPAHDRVDGVREPALEHRHRYYVVQIQALDEHPHEHGGPGVF